MTKILVADDSATIQKVIKIAFARLTYEMLEATSYPQAANFMLQPSAPSLMILDANLPGLHGPEGIQKLLGSKKIPVLLLVGSYDTVNEDVYRKAGFQNFLRKPFESADIVTYVDKLLAHSEKPPSLHQATPPMPSNPAFSVSDQPLPHAPLGSPPSFREPMGAMSTLPPRPPTTLPADLGQQTAPPPMPPPQVASLDLENSYQGRSRMPAASPLDLAVPKHDSFPAQLPPQMVPDPIQRGAPPLDLGGLHPGFQVTAPQVMAPPSPQTPRKQESATPPPPLLGMGPEGHLSSGLEGGPRTMRPSLGAEALDFPSSYQPPVSDLGGLRSSQPPPERIERSSPSAHPMLDPAGVPQKIQSAHGAQTEQAGRTPQGQRVLSITPRAASLAPETYPAPTQANTRASPPRPSQPMAPSDESDSTELSELLDLIRGELPALVSLAVQEYCEKHFAALAREVISAELRKLMEEKSRHLVDN